MARTPTDLVVRIVVDTSAFAAAMAQARQHVDELLAVWGTYPPAARQALLWGAYRRRSRALYRQRRRGRW